ncbi:MAG: hypothetical protein ABJN04_04530 [Hyphomicrobiales bacterium]
MIDQLGDVLAKGSALSDATVDGGEASQDTIDELSSAAKKALGSYDKSLFVDPAMKIFPEYNQLGFASIMSGDFEKCLKSMCDADGSGDDFSANLVRIGREGEGISELTDEVERLMAVANYFGVESRDEFESDAIAVIQMPEGEAGEDAGGNVDAFVERMQSFQSIVEFCGVSDETGANIRMIAADDALVVADLSSEGAHKLQNIISDVKSAKSDIAEIENASERLKNVGVSDKVIDLLDEETGLIRSFDESKAGSFIKSLLNGENRVTSKWMANAVMGLLDSGVRIDSVALKPQEDDEAIAVADEAADEVDETIAVVDEAAVEVDETVAVADEAAVEVDETIDVADEAAVEADETVAVADEMAVVADALEALDDEAATGEATDEDASDQAGETNDASSATTIPGAAALANANSFAAKNGMGMAASAVEGVTQKASNLAKEANDKVSSLKEEASNLADHASEQVEETIAAAGDAVSTATERASTVVDKAKEAVGNSVDETLENAETKSEAEMNAARAGKKNLRSIWETFSGRS